MIFNAANPTAIKHRLSAVYQITNRVNGKIYIGSASDFHRRFRQYRSKANRPHKASRPIEYAICKYGFDQFDFVIVEFVPDTSRLIEREQFWLDLFQPWNPKGYNANMIADSVLGTKRSKEQLQKISKSRKGVAVTEETRAALRAAHANKHPDDKAARDEHLTHWRKINVERMKTEYARPVLQIDVDTLEVVKEHPSVKAALASFGRTGGPISAACKGTEIKTAYGHYWCHKDTYDKQGFTPPTSKKKLSCHNFNRYKQSPT